MNTLSNEALRSPARLDELMRLRLLDTPPEETFDRLTRLAARLLAAPVALVSLVDDHRQFFKSAFGLPQPWATIRETPLSHSFCQHVVAGGQPLIVDDARAHALVCNNPAVTDLDVRAYLGIPLTTPKGTTLGSFCVIDSKPRKWTIGDQQTMAELAASVMNKIALRFANDELEAANRKLERDAAKREILLRVLERSTARLRAAQRLAGVGSFVLRPAAGHNDHWSDEACRIFSIAAKSAPATTQDFVDGLVHPEDRSRVAAAIEHTTGLNQSSRIEYRTCLPDGSRPGGGVRTVITTIQPEVGGDGGSGVLMTVVDDTERRQAEAKVAEYRSELGHVARVATAGEMATVVAHELNQPLASIAHTANACQRLIAIGHIGSDEIAGHFESIAQQARRASTIIGQIRSFVRKQPAAPQSLCFNRVVNNTLEMLSPWARQRGIVIRRIKAQDRLPMVGDEIQLGQLVLNLVRNAFDAVARNSVRERIVEVTTSSSADHVHIVLEVADNGPGISAEVAERIFEPFVSTRRDGLGMGLPIAKTIAEAHQAVLSVKPRAAGQSGACFQVMFPTSL